MIRAVKLIRDSHRSASPPPHLAGFTLTELLVVIVITGILASLVLPALSRARTAGLRTACVSNLRQTGVAIQMYAHDHEGLIPYGPVAPPFTSPASFYPSTGTPTSLLSLRDGKPVGLGLLLNSYLSGTPQVLFCPGADQPLDADAELAKVGTRQAQGSYYYRHAGVTQLFYTPSGRPDHIQLDALGKNRNGDPIQALAIDTMFISPPGLESFNVQTRTHHQMRFASILFADGHVGVRPNLDGRFTVDAVMERKSVDRELLSIAVMDTIAQAHNITHPQTESYNHYPDWGKYPPIKGLAKAKDVELNQQECKLIVGAITVATKEYWEKVEKWLGKTIPSAVDIVVISGGASEFLEPDLERYFNAAHAGRKKDHYSPWRRSGEYIAIDKDKPMPELLWGVEIIDLVRKKFNIDPDKDDHNMAIRLVDCYGLFDYLIGSMEGK